MQWWEGQHGTLLQSFPSHRAPVLSLAYNESLRAVYASGVDSKVVMFKEVSLPHRPLLHTWVSALTEFFITHLGVYIE